MFDWLIMTSAIALFMVVARADHLTYGVWLSPVTILGGPYLALAILAFFAGPSLGYVSLYTPSVLIWIGYLFLFWLSGRLFLLTMPTRKAIPQLANHEAVVRKVAVTIALASIPILAYGSLAGSAAAGGLGEYRSPEYRRLSSEGSVGHVMVLSLPVITYLIGTASKASKLNIVLASILLIELLLRPVKAWTILPN